MANSCRILMGCSSGGRRIDLARSSGISINIASIGQGSSISNNYNASFDLGDERRWTMEIRPWTEGDNGPRSMVYSQFSMIQWFQKRAKMCALMKPIVVREELIKRGALIFTPQDFQRIFHTNRFSTKYFLEEYTRVGLFLRLKK